MCLITRGNVAPASELMRVRALYATGTLESGCLPTYAAPNMPAPIAFPLSGLGRSPRPTQESFQGHPETRNVGGTWTRSRSPGLMGSVRRLDTGVGRHWNGGNFADLEFGEVLDCHSALAMV